MTKAKSEPITARRALSQIAGEIKEEWSIKPPSDSTVTYATPYLDAMLQMHYVEDMYGMEYGDMVVAYFLSNVTYWRGPAARQYKAEIKQLLDDYNNGVRYRNV